MRKFLTIITINFLFVGCDSNIANNNSSEDNVRKKVTEWISSNADFPASYKSIYFKDFEEIDFNIPGDSSKKYYRITHNYKLNSRNNKELSSTHFFVLTNDYKVSIISEEETSILQSVPPSVFDWAIAFGESFNNTDYGGLKENYFFQKFHDYKQIGGNLWRDLDYLDDECLIEFTNAINSKLKQKLQIKRVIRATPTFKTNLDTLKLNELGMDINHNYNAFPRMLFLVIRENNNESETFWISGYNRKNKLLYISDLKTGYNKSISFDDSFLNTNCFQWEIIQRE